MAKRRASRVKNRRKGHVKPFPGLMWATLALGIIGAVVTLLYLLPLPHTGPKTRPPFENFHLAPQNRLSPTPFRPESAVSMSSVAVLIDDMGYNLRIDNAFLKLEAPLSFSFLPDGPYTPTLARKASNIGKDVLIHLPLEPANGKLDPGPGVLCLDMDFDPMLRILKKDLDAVPCAIGVNNHMGSRFTANKRAMEFILAEIKRRDLFFIDSRTTKDTVAYVTAKAMGIPAAERAVFLDHDPGKKSIREEMKRLVKLSIKRGCALAIGHPTPNTLEVLHEDLPRLSKRVRLVPVHRILVSQ